MKGEISKIATIYYLKFPVSKKENYKICKETGKYKPCTGKIRSQQKLPVGATRCWISQRLPCNHYKYVQRTKVNHN